MKKGKNGQGAIVIGRMPLMLRSDRCIACTARTACTLTEGQWDLLAIREGAWRMGFISCAACHAGWGLVEATCHEGGVVNKTHVWSK